MAESAVNFQFPQVQEFVRESCESVNGFSRPNWKAISAFITTELGENRVAAWNEASVAWIEALRNDLGGDYTLVACGRFVLLSELEAGAAERFVQFAENSGEKIKSILGDTAWASEFGMHVILLFSEEDDYYEYISYFYPEGTHPSSAGVCLSRGYVHVALNRWTDQVSAHTLVHELAHLFVVHLQLPRWIDEAWAMAAEREIFGRGSPLIDRELADDLWEFWTEDRIQEFWAGTSFNIPGQSCQFSYRLSELLLNSVMRDIGAFREFLMEVDYSDGGQDAALRCLHISLGDIAGEFLGKGNWRPNRKKIAELWAAHRENATSSAHNGLLA